MIIIAFFYISIILIFVFIFITGFHDEGNLVATIITSRSLNIYLVFLLAFVSQFLGTLFLGTKVASLTISNLLNIDYIAKNPQKNSMILCAAMLGATIWNIITWIYKIPSSSSHAIIGGLLGPFIIEYGTAGINFGGVLFSVLLPLFTSPLIGYVFGYIIYKSNRFCFRKRGKYTKKFFMLFQVITCILINAFQGSNDAQKGMGVIALLLMVNMHSKNLYVSNDIILWSALAISFGLILGGLKMIRSVGKKIYNVKPIHSMSAQASSLIVIASASTLGFPISGTQIVNSAILGVGAADRPNAVGWQYAKNLLTAWVVTIPVALTMSAGFYLLFCCMEGLK